VTDKRETGYGHNLWWDIRAFSCVTPSRRAKMRVSTGTPDNRHNPDCISACRFVSFLIAIRKGSVYGIHHYPHSRSITSEP
jgi:hypothetical protein